MSMCKFKNHLTSFFWSDLSAVLFQISCMQFAATILQSYQLTEVLCWGFDILIFCFLLNCGWVKSFLSDSF